MANDNPASLTLTLTTGFHVVIYPAGATYGPRQLATYEFVWLLEGDAEYRHNDHRVEAPEGSFVLCRPPAVDFFRWDPRRTTRHAYFHFTLQGDLPEEWPKPEEWPLVRRPSVDGEDLLPALFRNLLAWGDSAANDTQTRFTALSLLAAFVTGRTFPDSLDTNSRLPEPVRLTLAHIARRIDRDPHAQVTLAELAGAASVTPEHLCRLFRAVTGHSPLETVRLRRLERAKTLLLRTNYTIGEVAGYCGFENPFHFSRCFKAAFGRSPRDFRQEG